MFVVIRHIVKFLRTLTQQVYTQVSTSARDYIMSHWKRLLVGIVVLLIICLVLFLYMYWRYTATFGIRRTPEHFLQFVSLHTHGDTMNAHLKHAEQHESRGEAITRATLESLLTPHKFPNVRLDVIMNPVTNTPLEFDCYNDELKLAVEYNGIQHYKFVPYFHQSKQDFYNQQYRDLIKKDLCAQHNIHLITIPYTVSTKEIPMFIASELAKLRL